MAPLSQYWKQYKDWLSVGRKEIRDISILNGVLVNTTNPHVGAFKARGAALGATEVLGPGDPGHATHVHLAWPRP